MLPDIKLEIGDKALFETKEKMGQVQENLSSSFFLKAELLEGVFGILLLSGINYFWFNDNPGFLGIHPHPYWFVILPIAVRYGFASGCLAGLTASFVHWYILYFLKDQQLIGAFWGQPLVFLFVSVCIGFFGEIRRTEHVKCKDDYHRMEKDFANLLTEYNSLVKYKEKKDSEMISQEDTFSSLYKAQEKINTLNESEIYPPLLNLLSKYLGVTSAAIYVLTENNKLLKQVVKISEDSDVFQLDVIEANVWPVRDILWKSQFLSLNDLTSRPDLHPFFKDKIMCAPIRGVRNRPLGMIIINKIPFNRLTIKTFQMFKSISDRCGASIEKARMYKITREKMVMDEKTGALTYSYLKERFDEEFSRAHRYGYTMSILLFEIQSFYGYDLNLQQEILIEFKKIIEKKLRNIDLLFHGNDRSQFILALPNTPIWGSRTVRDKLIVEMEDMVFLNGDGQPVSMSVIGGVAEKSPTMTSYIHLMDAAMQDLSFQKKLQECFEHACQSEDSVILLLFEILDFEKFSDALQKNITQIIEPLLRHHLKENDCLYILEHSAMYAIFFFNQDLQSIKLLSQTIIDEIKAFKIKPYEDETKKLFLLAGALNAKPKMKSADIWKKEVMEVMYNSEVMILFRYKFDHANKSNLPLTVMVIEIADYQIFLEEKQRDIITSLSLIFQNMMGDLDIMFYDSAPSRHILFLFQIDLSHAQFIRERIINEVRSFDFKPYTYEDKSLQIEAGLAQLYEFMTTPEQLIEAADKDLRFYKYAWYAFQDAKIKGSPLSLFLLKVIDYEKISSTVRHDLFHFLEELLLRYQTDKQKILHCFHDASYLILFPDTTVNELSVMDMSINDEIESFHMKPYRGTEEDLKIYTQVTHYDDEFETHYQLIRTAMEMIP